MAEENDDHEESEQPDVFYIDNLFQVILNRYQPAADFQDADLQMSTSEIYDHLQELCPGETFTAAQVYKKLFESNFKTEELGGNMNFVWLLKRK